jgi:hypothetical protein
MSFLGSDKYFYFKGRGIRFKQGKSNTMKNDHI